MQTHLLRVVHASLHVGDFGGELLLHLGGLLALLIYLGPSARMLRPRLLHLRLQRIDLLPLLSQLLHLKPKQLVAPPPHPPRSQAVKGHLTQVEKRWPESSYFLLY